MAESLTHERLLELLDYDPETGVFTWRITRGSTAQIGTEAGCLSKALGYVVIRLDDHLYRAHRLAWLYIHGVWPSRWIDHINMDRADNRIANLRSVSPTENHLNRRVRSDSKCGLKGVSRNPPGWMARIKREGKITHLGTFSTPEEAHAAYVKAAQEIAGEFARWD